MSFSLAQRKGPNTLAGTGENSGLKSLPGIYVRRRPSLGAGVTTIFSQELT
ncbi:hypothetical protein SELR_15300 [Selenomonas ruminantium subsp. lactilytica TAM6421]|uniref:Uncharacterized protein n=1 Tax=Selenomonas ruminantium subsp. lactilytica (strain NBRC 103574 / TAM6421) TaxID=927704 RepID=I0GR51_SELRL|nr:hypothetical protein SELR_15300 [Selenomonas ruminantium subsp. lactilytica TAM6421]